ncbi:hypothetical protein QFZ72_002463 [Bacillus sp. V2I10]|nr:hypothetical protein [Bacillus sp. V2I10]
MTAREIGINHLPLISMEKIRFLGEIIENNNEICGGTCKYRFKLE